MSDENKASSDVILQSLASQLLKDRQADRRIRYLKYGLIAASLLAALVLTSSKSENSTPASALPHVAVVRLSGAIGPGQDASAENINPLLTEAFEDRTAKGVVLLVNSPGGTPVQAALIHDRIKALKAQYPSKKVVVVAEDVMASGAYLVAVSADKIVVNRSTVAGSIGVIIRSFGVSGLMDKLGVERRVLTAGENKNQLDVFSPMADAEKAEQLQMLTRVHSHFIDIVKEGRGDRLKQDTPGLFSGRVWTGDEAVRIGIADELGDVYTVLKKDFGGAVMVEHAPSRSFLAGITKKFAVETAAGLSSAVDSPQVLLSR